MKEYNYEIYLFGNFYQIFVEALDKCFETVCELDLIFGIDKVLKF